MSLRITAALRSTSLSRMGAALSLTMLLAFLAGCQDNGAPLDESFSSEALEGRLTVVVRDDFDHATSSYEYLLETEHEIITLAFPFANAPSGFRTGDRVRVSGAYQDGKLHVASGDNGVQRLEIGARSEGLLRNITGTRNVLVIPVSFSDSVQSCTVSQLDTLMFGANNSVKGLYQEVSRGALTFTGTVASPITISATATGCNYTSWATAADTAVTAAGVSLSSYQHVVYVLPPSASSCFVGLGHMPGSRVWTGGNYCAGADNYAHELGHNLGMNHASKPSSAYADISDFMGFGLSGAGQYALRGSNAPHRHELGWLPAAEIQTVSTSGTYTVEQLGATGTGVRALVVNKPGTTQSYYLSLRKPVGYDANLTWIQSNFTSYGTYTDRLNIHLWDPNTASTTDTMLINTLPNSGSFSDSGITVTQVSQTATTATVNISFSSTSGPDTTAPSVSFGTPTNGATVSGTTGVTINAADNVGVTSVELTLDGASLGTRTTAPYTFSWNTTLSTNGAHTLGAIARDAAGNSSNASISVTVSNGTLDVTSPSVSITSPSPGATVSGTINVAISASDNVGVTLVDLKVDGTTVASWTTGAATYTHALDTRTLSNGSHTLAASASDARGNLSSYSFAVTVSNSVADTTAPTATITSPTAGSILSGTRTVSVSASDNVGVVRAELYVDSVLNASLTGTGAFSFSLNTATLSNGAHTLVARAYDAAGNVGASTSVSVTVSNVAIDATPPTVSLTGVTSGMSVRRGARVTLGATASDNVGVTRVDFYASGVVVCSDTSAPYSCSWRAPSQAGLSIALQARAFDAAGNSGSSATISVVTTR